MRLKHSIPAAAALTLSLLAQACGGGSSLPEPGTAASVDIARYAGRWYEIARLPFRFQEGCTATTATYTLNPDGTVAVLNACRKGALDGPSSEARAKAWAVDPPANSRLKVSFFWPFAGDYWILDRADDYSWSLVGTPDRKYLWILSRTPVMDAALLDRLTAKAREEGYPVDRLIRTLQPGAR